MPVAVTRIVNSCVLIEIGGYAVLGDPWFHDRWYLRFGEMPGMCISELPKLAGVIGSHSLPNHWDIQSLGGYAHKTTTPVFVATDQMAKQAKKVGFKEVAVMEWGTTWDIAPNLTLDTVQAHYSFGFRVNNYVLSSTGMRIFYGGEARDIEPLRAYRKKHPPVDVVLAPTNGVHFLGRKLVMNPKDLITAAQVLESQIIIPIHDALDPIYRYLPGFIFQRTGNTEETAQLANHLQNERIQVHHLETGVRWVSPNPIKYEIVGPSYWV